MKSDWRDKGCTSVGCLGILALWTLGFFFEQEVATFFGIAEGLVQLAFLGLVAVVAIGGAIKAVWYYFIDRDHHRATSK